MNKLFILGLIIFLTACYSREIPTTRGLLVRGVRAYNFHSNTNYNTAEERFQDIIDRNTLASDEAKAYAYMYLAKIKLKKSDVEKAVALLDKADNLSKSFPYKYEILADYFYKEKDFNKAEQYYRLLIEWLSNKINTIKLGKIDILKLEYTTSYSYASGQDINEYLDMYNPNLKRLERECAYLKYLVSRKKFAQTQIINCKKRLP